MVAQATVLLGHEEERSVQPTVLQRFRAQAGVPDVHVVNRAKITNSTSTIGDSFRGTKRGIESAHIVRIDMYSRNESTSK